MLVKAKNFEESVRYNYKSSNKYLKSLYSSSKNIHSGSSLNNSTLNQKKAKKKNRNLNFIEKNDGEKDKSNFSKKKNIRRSSFLQSLDKIGVDKNLKNLTNSIKRLEKSIHIEPSPNTEKSKKSEFLDKEKMATLIKSKLRKRNKNNANITSTRGFISSRQQVSFYDMNMNSYEKNKKASNNGKEKNSRSPRIFGIRNFFDSGSKNNSGGKVFVGDGYVNVKDIVKYHLVEGVRNKGSSRRNFDNKKRDRDSYSRGSVSLMEKISNLKSFRNV